MHGMCLLSKSSLEVMEESWVETVCHTRLRQASVVYSGAVHASGPITTLHELEVLQAQ